MRAMAASRSDANRSALRAALAPIRRTGATRPRDCRRPRTIATRRKDQQITNGHDVASDFQPQPPASANRGRACVVPRHDGESDSQTGVIWTLAGFICVQMNGARPRMKFIQPCTRFVRHHAKSVRLAANFVRGRAPLIRLVGAAYGLVRGSYGPGCSSSAAVRSSYDFLRGPSGVAILHRESYEAHLKSYDGRSASPHRRLGATGSYSNPCRAALTAQVSVPTCGTQHDRQVRRVFSTLSRKFGATK